MHLYSNTLFVSFCHFSDGTPEILISMSMHVLSFKNPFLTLAEQAEKAVHKSLCILAESVFSLQSCECR